MAGCDVEPVHNAMLSLLLYLKQEGVSAASVRCVAGATGRTRLFMIVSLDGPVETHKIPLVWEGFSVYVEPNLPNQEFAASRWKLIGWVFAAAIREVRDELQAAERRAR